MFFFPPSIQLDPFTLQLFDLWLLTLRLQRCNLIRPYRFHIKSSFACEKARRFRVLLRPFPSDKSRFVPESCAHGEKVSIRLSHSFFCYRFFLLPHFTNVWMPLMRNQDHSRGPQWSRSCDNLLFRCWLAVETGAASGWNCVRLSVGLGGSYSAFTPIPLKRTSQEKVQRTICGANLCFAFHATLWYGWGFFGF